MEVKQLVAFWCLLVQVVAARFPPSISELREKVSLLNSKNPSCLQC